MHKIPRMCPPLRREPALAGACCELIKLMAEECQLGALDPFVQPKSAILLLLDMLTLTALMTRLTPTSRAAAGLWHQPSAHLQKAERSQSQLVALTLEAVQLLH